MKYIGRFSAFILVSIMFFAYYSSKSGNVDKFELIGYLFCSFLHVGVENNMTKKDP